MKIFHLSDLHIGLTLCSRDMAEEQRHVLNIVVNAVKVEKPDAILIAGDIYDRAVPSAEAVKLFDDFLDDLVDAAGGSPIMIISGNHDSAERIDYLRGIVRKQGIYMIGKPPVKEDEFIEKVTLSDEFGEVDFYLLPFVKPTMVKAITGVDEDGRNLTYDKAIKFLLDRENIDSSRRNVIVSHQYYCPSGASDSVRRSDSEIKTVGNIDQVSSEYLKPFEYAALGHIHTPMSVGSDSVRYCGTPMVCSLSEEGQEKNIVVIELGKKGEPLKTSFIPLKPLHEIRTEEGLLEEILLRPSDDFVSVVITDKDEGIAQYNRDRIRAAFPNYLDISVKRDKKDYEIKDITTMKDKTPMDFCLEFMGEMSNEDIAIISDIINNLKEE